MSEQFLTDERMFFLAVAMFLAMAGIAVILLRRRDWDVLWVLLYETFQLLAIVYYGSLWRDGVSPVTQFALISLLIRPYIVLTSWFLVLAYTIYRLRQKARV